MRLRLADELTVASRAVGFDIGASSIKAVAVRKGLGGVSVERVARAEVARDRSGTATAEAVAAALEDVRRSLGARGGLAVSGVPTSSVAVRMLTVPFANLSQARQVVKAQVEPSIPFAIEEVVVDFIPLNRGAEGETEVLLTAVPKEAMAEHLERARAGGVEPEITDVDFAALYHGARALGAPIGSGGTVLIDLGAAKTTLCLVREGVPVSARAIAMGGDSITQAIAAEFGMGFAEAERLKIESADALGVEDDTQPGRLARAVRGALGRLQREITRTLHFFASQTREAGYERVFAVGGTARLRNIDRYLADVFGCEVGRIESGEGSQVHTGSGFEAEAFALGLGYALRGVGATVYRQNFRQEEFASPRRWRQIRPSLALGSVLVLGVVVSLVVGFFIRLDAKEGRYRWLRGLVDATIEATFPDRPDIRTVKQMEQEVARLSEELRRLRHENPVSVLRVLRELAAITPARMKVQLTRFKLVGNRLDFDGTLGTKDDAIELEALVRASPLFKVTRTDPVAAAGAVQKFGFSCRIVGEQ